MESRGAVRSAAMLALVAVVAFAGCGGDDGEDADGSGADEQFGLVEIQECVEENGYTVSGESEITPDEAIGLVAALPVADSGGGLVQVIEFEADADAASFVEAANEGAATGKFVVDPGSGTTEADVDVVSGCIE